MMKLDDFLVEKVVPPRTPFLEDVMDRLCAEHRASMEVTLQDARLVSFIHPDEAYLDFRPNAPGEFLTLKHLKPRTYWLEGSRSCGCFDGVLLSVSEQGTGYANYINHGPPACGDPQWYEHPEPMFVTLRGEDSRIAYSSHYGRTRHEVFVLWVTGRLVNLAAERLARMV